MSNNSSIDLKKKIELCIFNMKLNKNKVTYILKIVL